MQPTDEKNPQTNPPARPSPKIEKTAVIKFARESKQQGNQAIISSLFGPGYGTYEVRPESFLVSVLTHTLAIAALLWVLHLAVPSKPLERVSLTSTTLEPYIPMHIGRAAGGGGGGGDASKLQASAGTPPKVTMKQQLAPVTVIVSKEPPKIAVAPNVVADMRVAPSTQVGDPLSKAMVLSNGTGVRSGVGSGSGGGLGSGDPCRCRVVGMSHRLGMISLGVIDLQKRQWRAGGLRLSASKRRGQSQQTRRAHYRNTTTRHRVLRHSLSDRAKRMGR